MTWLDVAQVSTALGASIAEVIDNDALQSWCDATRDYVEQRRPDQWVFTYDPVTGAVTSSTYTPSASIVGGAALMAYRLYQRRTTPLGVLGVTNDQVSGILRDDPDISRMLGIGRHRRFGFGSPRPVVEGV